MRGDRTAAAQLQAAATQAVLAIARRDHRDNHFPVVCEHCGTTFYVPPMRFLRAKFCSQACKQGARKEAILDTFWERVDLSGDCWLWLGGYHKFGYGTVRYVRGDVRLYGSHRIAWYLTYGPIPAGLHVLHHCDNPPCCRPTHLFLGTQKTNSQDMAMKGRSLAGDRSPSRIHPEHMPRGDQHFTRRHPERMRRGEENPGARLTWEAVRTIRARYRPYKVSMARLASEFGVCRGTIELILRGETWKEAKELAPRAADRELSAGPTIGGRV